MANKNLFDTERGSVAVADTMNEAGGVAYSLSDAHALCNYVVTGTFNGTYYASAQEQLSEIKELCDKTDSVTLAKVAVYAREQAKMKDTPAYILAVLHARGENDLLSKAFFRVTDNVKMLLNFVQIVRSNVTGRRSFGTSTKNLIRQWISEQTSKQLFIASIGHSKPSLVDVIKMVHPKPQSEMQEALFGYLLGKEHRVDLLPQVVKDFEAFKKDNTASLPNIPFQSLSSCDLTTKHWEQISGQMGWNALRINLNTLHRNGVFEDKDVTEGIAHRISDRENVLKFNAFPYQLLTTYNNVQANVPTVVSHALHDAMEIATENIPNIDGDVAVCMDYSGSMGSPVTGNRGSATTNTSCRDVAGLISVCLLRQNPETKLIAWADSVRDVTKYFTSRDSVMSNCQKMRFVEVGCGTDAQLGLQELKRQGWKGKNIIYISDNQSWMNSTDPWGGRATGLANEWAAFKRKNPGAKMVNIHLQPYGTTQVQEDKDVLNVAGFSDSIFKIIASFLNNDGMSFVDAVNAVEL